MKQLWLYDVTTRLGLRDYRAKIMTAAFIGTHIPLIALVAFVALKSSHDWASFLSTLAVALAATLFGTGLTLFVLNHLLRPVLLTSRALRVYRKTRAVAALPTDYQDDVGTLMADAGATLAHLESALETLEFIDARTGMGNRKRLLQELARELGADKPLAVCALRFANYDRLLGALDLSSAEQVAAEIARRLQASVGGRRPVYRASGAEFVLLLEGASDPSGCEATAKACIAACAGAIEIAGVSVEPEMQAGVAFAPGDAADAEALLDHALGAAATAREEALVRFHSAAGRAAARERLRTEQELRRALARDEFVLHYQPVVDLSARRVIGAEALIRWRHPERGLLFPNAFIEIAETSGAIDEIGLWVVRNACRQAQQWRGGGFDRHIAVNLSARQFLDPNLVRHVREAIEEAGISADRLEIELTETAATTDFGYTRNAFGKLRDLGVRIAIDDFGAGFASMSSLRKLPFNKLKIDREFVANVNAMPENQAICSALVTLAGGLGLQVLAEGTETAEEVQFLHGCGCDLYQGYYFAKPMAPDDFEAGAGKAALLSNALRMRSMDAASGQGALPLAG